MITELTARTPEMNTDPITLVFVAILIAWFVIYHAIVKPYIDGEESFWHN